MCDNLSGDRYCKNLCPCKHFDLTYKNKYTFESLDIYKLLKLGKFSYFLANFNNYSTTLFSVLHSKQFYK